MKDARMEVLFNEAYLQEMYCTGQTDKKHRYQPQIIHKYIRVIDIMISTPDVQGLLRYFGKAEEDKSFIERLNQIRKYASVL